MRVRVDHAADAVYLNLTHRPIKDSEEVADGIVVEYDGEGRIVGIEMLCSMCGPKFCSMKITQDVTDYAGTLNDQQQGRGDKRRGAPQARQGRKKISTPEWRRCRRSLSTWRPRCMSIRRLR